MAGRHTLLTPPPWYGGKGILRKVATSLSPQARQSPLSSLLERAAGIIRPIMEGLKLGLSIERSLELTAIGRRAYAIKLVNKLNLSLTFVK